VVIAANDVAAATNKYGDSVPDGAPASEFRGDDAVHDAIDGIWDGDRVISPWQVDAAAHGSGSVRYGADLVTSLSTGRHRAYGSIGYQQIEDEWIGKALRALREGAGMEQREVADRLGWSGPRVSHIERSRVHLRYRDLVAYANLLGVALSEVDHLARSLRKAVQPMRERKDETVMGGFG
jgi:Helix-turn-helix domain